MGNVKRDDREFSFCVPCLGETISMSLIQVSRSTDFRSLSLLHGALAAGPQCFSEVLCAYFKLFH